MEDWDDESSQIQPNDERGSWQNAEKKKPAGFGRGRSKRGYVNGNYEARRPGERSYGTRSVQNFGNQRQGGFQRSEDAMAENWRERDHGQGGSRRNESSHGGYRGGRNQGGFGGSCDERSYRDGTGVSCDDGGFGSRGNKGAGRWKSSRFTEIVNVNPDRVRTVIGRGGSTIKEIQETSGAHVRVKKEEGSFFETPVEITADTEESVQKAVKMIQDLDEHGHMTTTNQNSHAQPEKPRISFAEIHAGREEAERRKWAGLPTIKKHFYFEVDSVKNKDPSDVEQFRQASNNIMVENYGETVQERAIPNPVTKFEEAFEQYPEILEEIKKAGFVKPSPIQCQAWPVVMSGMDLIGIAQTGTGKTLAFLLPAFLHIDGQELAREKRGGPSVLVLSPTRELALQIEQEVKKYHYRGIRSVCIYGGGSRKDQIGVVEKGVEIVIATPGRLNDLLMHDILSVRSVTYLVLDEADRMLDMGFEPEIKKILLDIRPDRQTVMTSATWPPGVQRMADQYMTDPVRVFVGCLDLNACENVTQLVEEVDVSLKKERVIEFIEGMAPGEKVLIFVGKKVLADDLSSDLMLHGIDGVQCIHGDREQYDREQALDDFKTGLARILIATDVASRGLDIKDITYVINYDFPRHIEDYVHRVGRTGRAGRSGTSLTFISREDWRSAHKLIKIMVQANQEVPDFLHDMAKRYEDFRERMSAERGDRGDRVEGDGCYKCGKYGHFARECPDAGGSGRGRGGRGGRRGGYDHSYGTGSYDEFESFDNSGRRGRKKDFMYAMMS